MQISNTAVRTTSMIRGLKVQIPVFVTSETYEDSADAILAAGIPMDAHVSIVQQTLTENISNNTAPAITTMIAEVLTSTGTEAWDGKISSLSDEQKRDVAGTIDMDAVQNLVDTYIASYIPGVRRASSADPIDPVENLARKLAKSAIQDKLEATTFTFNGETFTGVGRTARAASFKAFDAYCLETHDCTAAAFIDSKIDAALDAIPHFREKALTQLDDAAAVAESLSLSV